jgi:outer membrane protein assembly factor BamB
MIGLAASDGTLLWEYPWATFNGINAGQPIVIGTNRVFISSSYDQGAAVIEVSMNGSRGTLREIWRNNRMKNQFSSSVLHEGYIYGLDESILAWTRPPVIRCGKAAATGMAKSPLRAGTSLC